MMTMMTTVSRTFSREKNNENRIALQTREGLQCDFLCSKQNGLKLSSLQRCLSCFGDKREVGG